MLRTTKIIRKPIKAVQMKTRPLKQFHLFPKLPAEIRLMIWEMALPGPRIVHLVGFQIPALLHVNWEAKQVVEKHYKRCFEPQLEYYIYFSFAQDALFLERSRHLGILTGSNDQQDFSEFYSNLQSLVIGPDWDWERSGGYGGGDQRQWLFEHITKFERLDSIIQIINQVCPYRFKFMADLETEQFNRNWKELVPEYTMPLFANKTEHEVYREMTGYFIRRSKRRESPPRNRLEHNFGPSRWGYF